MKHKCQTFSDSIKYEDLLLLLYIFLKVSLGFGVLGGQKLFEDVTFGSWKLLQTFYFADLSKNRLTENNIDINR